VRPAAKKRTTRTSSRASVGIKHGFRSGLEERVAAQLQALGIDPRFESEVIKYTKPESQHKYTPDFPLGKVVIETKGRFMPEDRKKHLLIKEQHPELDIRFVFTNSNARITKTSKTTYADWCQKNGFKYADKLVPSDWVKEIHNHHPHQGHPK